MTIRRSFQNDGGILRRIVRRQASERRPALCRICESFEPAYPGTVCVNCEAEMGVGA